MKHRMGKRRPTAWGIFSLGAGAMVILLGLLASVDEFAPPSYSLSLATVQSVSAEAWLIFDADSGEVLYAHNEDESLPLASVTKLFTAAALMDSETVWSTTTIQWSDVAADGRAGKLEAGEEYMLYTLLFPLLLESSNDAAAALERTVPGLVAHMNEQASNTHTTTAHFADTSGLSADNTASAFDVFTLSSALYKDNPQLLSITKLPQYLSPTKGWLNNNPFINVTEYRGGKHGYLPEAGKTGVFFFDETLRFGTTRTIGYVLLGSKGLEYDISLLRDHVRQNAHFR